MILGKKTKFDIKYIYLILLILGLFIFYIIKYGNDINSHSLILTYLNIIENGYYTPSRFYDNPLSEIIIGFFSLI